MNLDYDESDSMTIGAATSPLAAHSILQTPLLSTPVVNRHANQQSRVGQPISRSNMSVTTGSFGNSSDLSLDEAGNTFYNERNYSNDSTSSSNASRSTYDDEKHKQKTASTPLKHTTGFTSGGKTSNGLFNKWIGF